MLYNVAATLISPLGGRQIDRTGPTRILTAGIAAFAVAYLLFAVTGPSILLLAPAFVGCTPKTSGESRSNSSKTSPSQLRRVRACRARVPRSCGG